MKNYKSLMILALTVLAGCDAVTPPPPSQGPDQCLRREIFQQCLASLPKGPTATVNNDWAEVVDECETAAWKQAYRQSKFIKPECKSQ